MKRFSKVLALCLLLALTLSVFAAFSAFAEEEVTYGETVADMNAPGTSIPTVTSGSTQGPKFLDLTEDGHRVWKMDFAGYTKPGSAGEYWTIGTTGTGFGSFASSTFINDRGNNKKNTDYMVIDFDISTDTNFINDLYFHTRWLDAAGNNVQHVTSYLEIKGTSYDDLWIGPDSGMNYNAPLTVGTNNKWINVTLVYDFSSATPANWTTYIYYDGIYSGNMDAAPDNATVLSFIRVSTDPQVLHNTSTKFANLTVKRFGTDYDGPMTQSSTLGYAGMTLDMLPDLAYTQENTPGGTRGKIADLVRNGVTTPIYRFDELDASLELGDKVILYSNINKSLLVPAGGTEGITWITGDYTMKAPTELDYSALGWAIRNPETGAVSKSGADGTDLATAMGTKSTANIQVTLFDDITYEPNRGTADKNAYAVEGYKLIFDMNGHKLNIIGSYRCFSLSGTGTLAFKNGALEYAPTAGDMAMPYSGKIVFENLTSLKHSGKNMMIDHRGGLVYLKDCDNVTAAATFVNSKSSGKAMTSIFFDNTDYTNTVSNCISVSNISSGGSWQGSMHVNVKVVNGSNLTSANEAAFTVTTYGDEACSYTQEEIDGETVTTVNHVNAKYGLNDNRAWITISDSSVTASGALVGSEVAELNIIKINDKEQAFENHGLTNVVKHPNDGFITDIDIDISDSFVKASYLSKSDVTASFGSAFPDATYDYNIDVVVNNSELELSGDTIVYRSQNDEAINVAIGAEVNLTSDKASNIDKNVTMTIPDGYNIEKRIESPDHNFTHVVTNTYMTYSYILNGQEFEFEWYAGDVMTAEYLPIELPASNAYYTYKWVYNVDGAYVAVPEGDIPVKASLTLYNDFTLNVYIPADLGAKSYDAIYADGKPVKVGVSNVNGTVYRVLQIPGITPTSSADKVKIELKAYVDDYNYAEVVKEISVVDYAKSVLENDSISADDKKLVASVVNYVDAAYKYGGKTDAKLAALVASDAYTGIQLDKNSQPVASDTVTGLGIFKNVALSLGTDVSFTFVTADDFDGNIVFTYYKNGRRFVETKKAGPDMTIKVSVRAFDLMKDIKVSYGGEKVGTYNLAAYVEAAKALNPDDTALIDLLDALWIYSEQAQTIAAARS